MRVRGRRLCGLGLSCVLTVVAGACDFLTGPEFALRVATVNVPEVPPSVPSTVTAGEPFVVDIPFVRPCPPRLGPVDVEVYVSAIALTPYVETETDPDVLCPGSLGYLRHEVALTWPEEWDFVITIYALDFESGEPVLLRYPVAVSASESRRGREQ